MWIHYLSRFITCISGQNSDLMDDTQWGITRDALHQWSYPAWWLEIFRKFFVVPGQIQICGKFGYFQQVGHFQHFGYFQHFAYFQHFGYFQPRALGRVREIEIFKISSLILTENLVLVQDRPKLMSFSLNSVQKITKNATRACPVGIAHARANPVSNIFTTSVLSSTSTVFSPVFCSKIYTKNTDVSPISPHRIR